MSVAELVSELETVGVRMWEEAGQLRYRAPKGTMTPQRLGALRDSKAAVLEYLRGGAQALVVDAERRHEPFPLTDVQSAYLLGRRNVFDYGGVGCHAYGELGFAVLDTERLERAWQVLVQRHPMLRAVIDESGSQRVLAEVPPFEIAVRELEDESAEGFEGQLDRTREEMDHRVYSPGDWPLFDLRVTRGASRSVLHFSIDFLIADYVSIQLLLDELATLYEAPETALPVLDLTFRDYLLSEHRLRAGSRMDRDRTYWLDRIDSLPAAPELPIRDRGSDDAAPRFARLEFVLTQNEWDGLRAHAGAQGLTVSGAVLGAYAEVIGRWSRHPRFIIDVTVLNRLPLHEQVDHLVGDFTTVDLLAVEPEGRDTFAERAKGVQAQLWQDLDHRLFSGVDVMRELARRRGKAAALMPVVFTSAIGLRRDEGAHVNGPVFGEPMRGISQTPQVWIDCQVMRRGGTLAINWDVREGTLLDGVASDMFAAFESFVRRLAVDSAAWSARFPVSLPPHQWARRQEVNATSAPLPSGLLHSGVVAQALRTPDRLAIACADGRTLDYHELLGRALELVQVLSSHDCRPDEIVAIVMDKGWEQIVAVIAVLLAGGVYLPIDPSQPRARRDRMLERAGARTVLTQSWLDGNGDGDGDGGSERWPASVKGVVAVDRLAIAANASLPEISRNPSDRAYVIFTSGSTGQPKGVVISHLGALNTVSDINQRFRVDEADATLALASLWFDLSVYDIFGPLSRGGCIVLPSAERRGDPSHWAELVDQHSVTILNGVPAQLHMFNDYLQSEGAVLGSVRIVLLSGDWIPVTLPDQLRTRLPAHEAVISLGGATEASIWSIIYPVGEAAPHGRSIPYGKPLNNQTFHVLDSHMQPCPDWVRGELYIGGEGVAIEYLNDEQETARRFVSHAETGERLYRTGDFGRYFPDGNIEFLGREDDQVKIRGHRIELAEVETAATAHPAVAAAVALAAGQPPLDQYLALFAESAKRSGTGELGALRSALYETLVAAGERFNGAVDCEGVVAFARLLDRVALLGMLHSLQREELFGVPSDCHTLEEIFSQAAVAPKHQRLIRRWLTALVEHGLLEYDGERRVYRGARRVDEAELHAGWSEIDKLQPTIGHRSELIGYFRSAAQHLNALMRGEQDPVQLLFPEGRLDIQEAAYTGNHLSNYLNHLVTQALKTLAAKFSGPGRLQVLEIGAGVGGTSTEVIAALETADVDYVFTDVSRFFLNKASEKFAEYPWVRYALFDLNQDYRAQGMVPNSFDVILCANVLHYARDARAALSRIRELLKPDGWLVFIDTTRDNYQILTSMEFLFDASAGDFEDVRKGRDATFVTRTQWFEMLEQAGASCVMCLPEPDSVLAEIGMHVFIAPLKSDRMRVDAESLLQHLKRELTSAMVPSHVEVVDQLPLTDNGKIDRRTLKAWLPSHAGSEMLKDESAADELERQLTQIWAQVLKQGTVGRHSDFFQLGGDSLLASQAVTRIREEVPGASSLFFEQLLRCMLEGPTVVSLAAHIREHAVPAAGAAAQSSASPLVDLAGSGSEVRVLLHDATGTLAAYAPLLERLRPTATLLGFEARDPGRLEMHSPERTVPELSAEYRQLLLERGHTSVQLVGVDTAGPLALELARQLSEAGVRTAVVVMGDVVRPAVSDGLLQEYLFVRALGLDPVQLGFPSEAALGAALAMLLADSPASITEGSVLRVPAAQHPEVSRCFSNLCRRSPEERLAAIEACSEGLSPAGDLAAALDVFSQGWNAYNLDSTRAYADAVTFIEFEQGLFPGAASNVERALRDVCLADLQCVRVPGARLGAGNAAAVTQALLAASGGARS